MPAIIIILAFISCFMLYYGFISHSLQDKLTVTLRLRSISKSKAGNEDAELNQPLFSRVLQPMLDNMAKLMMRITPGQLVSSLESKVIKAGNPGNMAVKDWINIEAMPDVGRPAITLLALSK